MKDIAITKQFKRDAKKHYVELITPAWNEVLHCLLHNIPLPIKYKDHQLVGNLKDFRDCHVRPDLVLLYRLTDTTVELVRLGNHSELAI